MSSLRRLRRLFQITALASFATACGGGVGTPDATEPGPGVPPGDPRTPPDPSTPSVDKTGFTQMCDGTDGYSKALVGLTAGNPVDYLELRSQSEPLAKAEGQKASPGDGTLCKSATDEAACKSAFASLTATGWPSGGMIRQYSYLAYSRGDEVGVVDTIPGVTAFLAPIDTAKDAALVLAYQYHRVNCQGPNVRPASSGGFDVVTITGDGCGPGNDIKEHIMNVSPSGVVTEVSSVLVKTGEPSCSHGRRPEGLVPRDGGARGLADFLCEMTHLEAASVHAFDRLARELEVHGAPRRLVKDALRAKQDEVRHAEMVGKLATRAGGKTEAPEVPELVVRDLFAIAMENAVEGCVAETFAALLAEVQWRRAGDPAIARAMRIIAGDETRHAALAWDVASWIESQLTPEQRAEVSDARRRAAGNLRASFTAEFSDEIRELAGMPSAREAQLLIDSVAGELWAA